MRHALRSPDQKLGISRLQVQPGGHEDSRMMKHRSISLLLTFSIAAAVAGCTSGSPATPGVPTAPAPSIATPAAPISTPATPTTPPTVNASTPTPAGVASAPPGATTFHVVLSDGPKEGTYDASSTDQLACSYIPELDIWSAEYSGATPLSTIDIDLSEDFPNFSMSFDSGTPDAAYMKPTGPFPYQVDDRGPTATITFNLEEAAMNFEGERADLIGPVEVTVECASIYRYD